MTVTIEPWADGVDLAGWTIEGPVWIKGDDQVIDATALVVTRDGHRRAIWYDKKAGGLRSIDL